MKILVALNYPQYFFDEKTIVLLYDNWDDYTYKTTFNMFYAFGNEYKNIGAVKIFCSLTKNTYNFLTSPFIMLDRSIFCSLGQDIEYYENLKEYFPDDYEDILYNLNDIAYFENIKDKFMNQEGVRVSLLRFSSAEKALKEAKKILDKPNNYNNNNVSFKYLAKVPYNDSIFQLDFDFKKNTNLPYRINVLIGKNGTGKTHLLTNLANSLSGYNDEAEKFNVFKNERPPFDRVMSISYSAFDQFKKPIRPNNSRRVFSYVYCGIQNEHGTLSTTALRSNFLKSYKKVIKKNRLDIWEKVLHTILNDSQINEINFRENNVFENVKLSSGQNILLCTITEIIANIERESIILFDEPEIHLHPNAISNIIRMFYELLEEFNSYAIFSTHSPMILQEIPSKYIHVLSRIDDFLSVKKPTIETFGNNISDIVMDVFDIQENESNYKTILERLSKKNTYNEIIDIFNGKLSLNALLYLSSCFSEEI